MTAKVFPGLAAHVKIESPPPDVMLGLFPQPIRQQARGEGRRQSQIPCGV
jgi:hypothetical protein